MLKKIALGFVLVLVVAQFVRPARNEAAGSGPNDISVKHAVPAGVQSVLKRACYDCHSNHTRYPWYAEVQPARWWLEHHIADGKKHLNFSEFGAYPAKRAAKKAEEIADEVEQHNMPLKSYLWLHPEARLTAEEIKQLTAWAEALRDQIAAP